MPYSFCMSWIDDKSPAVLYQERDGQAHGEPVSQKQDVGWMKSLKRRWPLKKSKINAAIESFECFIESLNLAVTLKNALPIPYFQIGQTSRAELFHPIGDALNAISRQVEHQRAAGSGKSVLISAVIDSFIEDRRPTGGVLAPHARKRQPHD
ncbi:hypothetical protein BU15DRAFT_69647 [Melanogaster broomeanus]|nr:hypothetical protein BU15DRAFT_69647 [Melanogaster broomeanus]